MKSVPGDGSKRKTYLPRARTFKWAVFPAGYEGRGEPLAGGWNKAAALRAARRAGAEGDLVAVRLTPAERAAMDERQHGVLAEIDAGHYAPTRGA